MISPDLTLEAASPEVRQYQHLKISALLISGGLGLAWLALLAIWLGPEIGRWLREHLTENRWLELFAVGAFFAVTFDLLTAPIDYWSGYVVEHRFGLSNQTLAGWFWRRLKGYLLGGVIGLIMLAGLYWLLWTTGAWWWIWATVGWLFVSLVMGRLLPVIILPLFYKVSRLEDESLLSRLRTLTQGTTLNVEGVYRLELSKDTKKANAALAGLGNTRRVLLGDTLLEQFSPEEIEVVFAHEVGHHVHRHILKALALGVSTSLCGFWLVDALLNRLAPALGYDSFLDPAALPLILLVLSLFGLTLSPAHNAISRFYERQCDRYALDKTGNPSAYRSAFIKLAHINKSNPDPNPIIAWFFFDHPPIRERLAMAE
jgi:STE24 endopeptidase